MKAVRIESASHPSNLLTLGSNTTHSRVPLVYSTLTRITGNCSPLLLSRTSRVYCSAFAYLARKVKIRSTVLLNMPHFCQENQSQITVNWDLLCVKIKSVHEYALSQAIMRFFSTFFLFYSAFNRLLQWKESCCLIMFRRITAFIFIYIKFPILC